MMQYAWILLALFALASCGSASADRDDHSGDDRGNGYHDDHHHNHYDDDNDDDDNRRDHSWP